MEASWSLEELASLIQEERLAIVRLDFRGLEVCAYIVYMELASLIQEEKLAIARLDFRCLEVSVYIVYMDRAAR